MRSVAVQSDQELGGGVSVLVRQKRDHVHLEKLLARLESSAGIEQDRTLLDVYRLVFPHAFAEESVLWPVMRRVLPDGHDLTLEVEREHQEVNELVTELERVKPGESRRDEILSRLVAVLKEDVRDEEDVLFPRLQNVLGRRQLQLLGLAWETVRLVAPTRAHPIVARRPPGNVVAALPLTVIDRLRDRIDGRLLENACGGLLLRGASGALARTGHRIERLPMMRRGEDPSTAVNRPRRSGPRLSVALPAALVLLLLLSRRKSSHRH
jgi:hemerythrin superfamily protein